MPGSTCGPSTSRIDAASMSLDCACADLPPGGDAPSPSGNDLDAAAEDVVDVRFITEPVAIRPGERMSYGVPFDMVDTSEGSAVDALIKSMQEAELAGD